MAPRRGRAAEFLLGCGDQTHPFSPNLQCGDNPRFFGVLRLLPTTYALAFILRRQSVVRIRTAILFRNLV